MRRRYCHIVAHGDNFAIGAKGGMPWHLPEDLKYFKKITAGHVVVMGRKTFDSISRPLPSRLNIVISRHMEVREGLVVARSWDEAKALLEAREDWPETVFVIGGAMLYNESLPDVVGAYVTRVPLSPEADTFYPDISQNGFVRKTVELGSSAPQLSYQYWER